MKKWFLYAVLLCGTATIGYTLHSLFTPRKLRVYADVTADLFHYGHRSFLKEAKKFGDVLVVGVISDEDARSYKRLPYMTLDERCKSVAGCQFVDEVIPNAPLHTTAEFIKEHNIDVVIHGDDYSEETINLYYKDPIEMGIFRTIPYTKGISTSEIIRRIESRAAAAA